VPTIPFFGWIANAAAYLTGSHGAVAQQARQTGCSRQCACDHAEKVLAAVEARHGGGPTPEELIRQNEALPSVAPLGRKTGFPLEFDSATRPNSGRWHETFRQ
jgi:hypothetical protein